MNYGQARAYAVNVSRSGSILGLDSIENLMHELGDIQEQLKIIHIAGTNGKGSTGAYLERVLIEAGYRVGRYSSPAVFDPMEVWRINLQSMSHEEYADIRRFLKWKQRWHFCIFIRKNVIMYCWKLEWAAEQMQRI